MSEEINHPDRYAGGKYECIEVMIDIFGVEFVKNFCVLNAFKYLWRHKQKGGTEDIKKAVWYLNEYIELDEAVPAVMVNKPVDLDRKRSDLFCENKGEKDYGYEAYYNKELGVAIPVITEKKIVKEDPLNNVWINGHEYCGELTLD